MKIFVCHIKSFKCKKKKKAPKWQQYFTVAQYITQGCDTYTKTITLVFCHLQFLTFANNPAKGEFQTLHTMYLTFPTPHKFSP